MAVQQHKATRKELTIIGVVLAGAFLAILNQTVLSPALPKLMETFEITAGTAQWVTSIYLLVNGIMVPISGFLIDRFPTRKLFFASMLAFIAGTALCAVAPSFFVLIVGRVLQAAGAGVQLPLVAVVPMLIFPPEKRGTANIELVPDSTVADDEVVARLAEWAPEQKTARAGETARGAQPPVAHETPEGAAL